MPKNLVAPLAVFRRRKNRYKHFTTDLWAIINSEIDPPKFHALGVIQFRWNISEQALLSLFAAVLNCPTSDEVYILAHDLGDVALCNRIKLISAIRHAKKPKIIAAISNALEVYDICRQNRNQVTHFSVKIALRMEVTGGDDFELTRRNKAPNPKPDEPFKSGLRDLRRVAKEIRRLTVNLKLICRALFELKQTGRTPPLPRTLALPELLWTPPQAAKASQPQRPPSQPSRRQRRNAALARAKKS